MVGKTLADRYRLAERLSGGEVLSTYGAEDLAFGTEVEIDVLARRMEECIVSPRRLEEILDAGMLVRGPHISPLHGWGEEIDGGFIYMVRERAQGASLAEILSGTGQLPLSQVVEISGAVVEVLAEAYGREIFYLGLNPGQIFLDGRGGIKLFRVGFAWVLEDMEPSLAAGVSPYRAPETDGGREGSRTADVYALAVMLREMVDPGEISERLGFLLDTAVDPLPRRRPSSPRLLFEELDGRDDDVGGETSLAAVDPGREGRAERPGGLGFLKDAAGSSSPPVSRKSRGRALRYLLMVMVAGIILWLVFAAVAGVLGGRKPRGPITPEPVEDRVVLPDLQGLTVEEAEGVLDELGLKSTCREAPSRLWSAGRVAAQEPGEGSAMRVGDEVCLIISAGREREGGANGDGGESVPVSEERDGDGASAPASSPSNPLVPAAKPSPPPRNLPPRAVPALSSHAGPAPLCVTMDASASYDPDGSISRYVWHCGDGTVLQGIRAQHVYDPEVIPARFQVILEVFDAAGLSHSSALTVEVY